MSRFLDFKGNVTIGEEARQLREAIEKALESSVRKVRKILLNFGDVTNMDTAAIGELVSSHTAVKNNGGRLQLLSLSEKIDTRLNLLTTTKPITVFECYNDETKAVRSFS